MNLCGKLLTEREGKSIGLAFFLVVAIKSNLSTFAGAKVQNKFERDAVALKFILSASGKPPQYSDPLSARS